MKYLKSIWIRVLLVIFVVELFSYFFDQKLFPAEDFLWDKKSAEVGNDDLLPSNFGWEGENFWASLSFPGKQNVCIEINSEDNIFKKVPTKIPLEVTVRANLYPLAGSLDDLLSSQVALEVQKRINDKKPFLLSHSFQNIVRDGKNTFFLGENEKFLIPDRNILKTYFPFALDIPQKDTSSLPYSSKLISLPEGYLFSHANGVFVVSERKPALIRSPEVFESLGYSWNDVKEISNFEYDLLSGERLVLLGFGSTHPNGTLLKTANEEFFVFEGKRYKMKEGDKEKYFPNQPEVSVGETNSEAYCQKNGASVECCVKDFDPRIEPPKSFPYFGTIDWNLSEVISREKTEKIKLHSKIIINQENATRRLKSFKNYILAQFGLA